MLQLAEAKELASKFFMIRVFVSPNCLYCFTLKKFLREKRVLFEEIDVSKNKKAGREIAEKSGQRGVPVVEIDGTLIVGFSRGKIEKLLKARGK